LPLFDVRVMRVTQQRAWIRDIPAADADEARERAMEAAGDDKYIQWEDGECNEPEVERIVPIRRSR
jgi:hypothetical protein